MQLLFVFDKASNDKLCWVNIYSLLRNLLWVYAEIQFSLSQESYLCWVVGKRISWDNPILNNMRSSLVRKNVYRDDIIAWKMLKLAQSKTSACTRFVEAEQLQDDEPFKSTFFNSSSQLLRNVLICLCLIGQFRIELNRAELVHGFFNLSKGGLPLMEAKIIESIMLKMLQISYLTQ